MIGLYFCGESIVFLWVLIKLLGSFVVMGFAMHLFHIFMHYVSGFLVKFCFFSVISFCLLVCSTCMAIQIQMQVKENMAFRQYLWVSITCF